MPTFKDFVARASNTSAGWYFLSRLWKIEDKLQKLQRYAERHRSVGASEDFYKRVRNKFPEQEVRNGPFKGLRYGSQESVGSSLIPKFLGSYENELHPWLATVAARKYPVIVDVGCAEGYYAIGLARLLPAAHVFAYDTNPAARESCKHMARLNDVADRVTVNAFCDPATLRSMDLSAGALVICDCEGYEADLFDPETVAHLAQSDVVIECHHHIGKPITQTLTDAFSATHKVRIVETVADHQKALTPNLPELDGEPYPVRIYMVEERRKAPQNFLILEARH